MIEITKAGSIGDVVPPDVIIHISGEPPHFPGLGNEWPQRARQFYKDQAKRLVDTLFESLPGGTVDQVLCKLLEKKVSLYRISFKE